MKSLLPFDSPAVRLGYKAGTLILVNLLWLLFCLPVVTVGASTAAMYRIIFDMRLGRENKSMMRRFVRAFRADFKQATQVWLLLLMPILLIVFNFGMLMSGQLTGIALYAICFAPIPIVMFILSYAFAYAAMFEDGPVVTIRNSMIISIKNIVPSLFMMLMNLLPVAVFVLFTETFLRLMFVWLMIGFSLIAYINSRFILHAFEPYLPKKTEAENA